METTKRKADDTVLYLSSVFSSLNEKKAARGARTAYFSFSKQLNSRLNSTSRVLVRKHHARDVRDYLQAGE